jgi:acetyl-CoA synthetase
LFEFGGRFVWKPSPEVIEHANLTRFMRQHGIVDFEALLRRSTEDVAWFTDAIFKFLDIRFYQPYERVLDLSEGIQFPRWCAGGKLNIVHNCVDKYQGTALASRTAVLWEGEAGQSRRLTYQQLNLQVNQVANALRALGLGMGDAIGLFMPMTPEIVVASSCRYSLDTARERSRHAWRMLGQRRCLPRTASLDVASLWR